ncbi:MAG: quinolinate synthase NadA, partial [Candidatus Helarchaeota archaeon]
PNAITIVHPECPPEVQQIADFIGSTSQMEKFVKTSDRKEFIVGTEVGLIDKLKRETEGKIFYKAHDKPICYNMKKNTLETIKYVLEKLPDEHLVKIPEEIAKKNQRLLNDMLKNSK